MPQLDPKAPGQVVTIRDVARFAGVSPSTVSNLLNGRDARMRAATRRRVGRAIEELGYQPSLVARQLRTGRGRMVGLIVPSIANPFWASFARDLEAQALECDYQVMLCNSEREPDRERSYVDGLWASGVRTVVLGSSLPSLAHLMPAIERGLQLITLDREAEAEELPLVNVSVDNQLGGLLATNHLLSLGHRRIGFVSGAIATVSRRRRLSGYRLALEQADVPFAQELVWAEQASGGYGDVEGVELGKLATRTLLDLPKPPSGLVTINDMYAIGAIAAVRERGLRVPADVSVVGFDDIFFAQLFEPALSTVAQPVAEMARLVVDIIRGAYSVSPDTSSSVIVAPRLVVRASSGQAAGGSAPPRKATRKRT